MFTDWGYGVLTHGQVLPKHQRRSNPDGIHASKMARESSHLKTRKNHKQATHIGRCSTRPSLNSGEPAWSARSCRSSCSERRQARRAAQELMAALQPTAEPEEPARGARRSDHCHWLPGRVRRLCAVAALRGSGCERFLVHLKASDGRKQTDLKRRKRLDLCAELKHLCAADTFVAYSGPRSAALAAAPSTAAPGEPADPAPAGRSRKAPAQSEQPMASAGAGTFPRSPLPTKSVGVRHREKGGPLPWASQNP